jgi:hypothetical protein
MPVTGASGCKVSTGAVPGQVAEGTCRKPMPAEGCLSRRLRNTDLKVGRASAALISYWNELVRGVLVVIEFLIAVLPWGFQLMQRAWSKTTGARFHPKREPPSLRFEQDERQSSWSATRFGSRAGTHLHGHWFVTNTSNRNLRLLKARVHKHGADFTNVFTQHPDRNVFGRYPIQAHALSEVVMDFTFFSPMGRGREPIVASVIFTDNYGDEHLLQSVRFRCEQ